MPITFGQVGAPSNTSAADATNLPFLQGKAAEGVVTELHGKYYTANYRGRHFMTQGASAGVTIPVSSSTVPTFTVFNPIGSGIIMELGKLNIGINNATTVVSSIHWGIISGLTVAPTGVTAMATGTANIGGPGVPLGLVYSAATLAAASTKFFDLFSVSAAAGAFPNFNYDHEGSLILQPGSLVHLCGTAAQTNATLNSLTWSEWPQ
jgi:hypothetical protein